MSRAKPSESDRQVDYFCLLHRQTIVLEGGYWVTFRVQRVEPDEQRPHGLQYALSFHDPDGERLIGYDNAHRVSSQSGPARRSKTSVANDHRHRLGRTSPYRFTTTLKLLDDFWSDVQDFLAKEGMS